MMINKCINCIGVWLFSVILFFSPQISLGAGFEYQTKSAASLGSAFAGTTVSAEDASIAFQNPAAMSLLSGVQTQLGAYFLPTNFSFSNKGSINAVNGNAGSLQGDDNATKINSLVPNFYYVDAKKDIKYGFSINVPFGSSTLYDDTWVGRYHTVKSALRVINISPAIAYKVNPNLSVGGGISIQLLDVELTQAIDFAAVLGSSQQNRDGFSKITGDNTAYGFNLGILYEFAQGHRFGLSYRSQVTHDVSGKADFTLPSGLSPASFGGLFVDSSVKAQADIPAVMIFSYLHKLNDKWDILSDVAWTQWSSFEELRIKYANDRQPDSVTTFKWNNTIRYAIAANYQLSSAYKLRFGLSYDPTPVPNKERRTARIPDSDRLWIGTGIGWQYSDTLNFDFGYSYIYIEKFKINNTLETTTPSLNHTLVGEFDGSAHIFGAQLVWKL